MSRRKTGPAGMTESKARAIVRERSGGDCELRIPGVCLGQATNFQHRRNRSQSGPWTPSNGIDVCGSGTTGCHGYIHQNPNEATENGWTVKSWEDWHTKPALLWNGYCVLDDQDGWTNLGFEPPIPNDHKFSCSFWESDHCSCALEAS